MRMLASVRVQELFVGMPGKAIPEINMSFHGVEEDKKHFGPTLVAGPRVRQGAPKLPPGTIDENWRKFSAVSVAEVAEVRHAYETEYKKQFSGFDACFLGANIVLEGIESTSKLPQGTIIDFGNGGPLLAVTSENTACKNPGIEICRRFALPENEAKKFVGFARGRRGIVGTVLRPGKITVGLEASIFVSATSFGGFA
jgi:hypothetical protein